MDDLGLDDMVTSVNNKKKDARKNKNAVPQLMKRIRANDPQVTKVVHRDDPVAKTCETIFRALQKNTHIEILNLKNVKVSAKAAKSLAKALKKNTTLHTLILYAEVPSEEMNEIAKALEKNNTIGTLKLWNGMTNNKYWESWVEPNLKKSLCEEGGNNHIINMHIGPIRNTAVKNALEKQPHYNRITQQKIAEGTAKDADAGDANGEDDWLAMASKYDYDDSEDDYEYVYDPTWGGTKEEGADLYQGE